MTIGTFNKTPSSGFLSILQPSAVFPSVVVALDTVVQCRCGFLSTSAFSFSPELVDATTAVNSCKVLGVTDVLSCVPPLEGLTAAANNRVTCRCSLTLSRTNRSCSRRNKRLLWCRDFGDCLSCTSPTLAPLGMPGPFAHSRASRPPNCIPIQSHFSPLNLLCVFD